MDYSKKITIKNKVTKEAKRVRLVDALAMEDENWIIAGKKALKQRQRNSDFSKSVASNWTSVVEEYSVDNKVKGSVKTKFVTVIKLKMYNKDFGTGRFKTRKLSGNNAKSTRGRMKQVVSVVKSIESDGVIYQLATKRKRNIIHVRQ